ncbi:hypothetical protein DINM_005237 [Dirofilaria immitis]|nr:hypothetical protein [Dirofilaria immitis]
MSDSDTISLFNNVISAVLSMIGTFALLILFGCVFKTRNARIDKTPEIHQESIIFHKDKDAEALIERRPNQVINPELIKLIEPTQNSDTNSANREKVFMEKEKDVTNNKKKSEKENLYSNKRNGHQILIQKTIKPELENLGRKTQSTQQDDFKDSRPNSKIHILDMLRRRRRSEMSKRYKHNTAEEIHEGFIRTQTREEEPSTLEVLHPLLVTMPHQLSINYASLASR